MGQQKDARSYTRFEDVLTDGYAAIAKLDERAAETSDPDTRQALAERAHRIRAKLREIRRAERVTLTTPDGSDDNAVALLNAAVKQARREREALDNVATAIAGADRMLSLFTRLISILA